MFCKNCGKEIDDDSIYCKFCGVDLGKSNNHINGNELTIKTKEESPIKIEVSKSGIFSNSFKKLSLKTAIADVIVLVSRGTIKFLKDALITLLYYTPLYLVFFFVFIIIFKVPLGDNWFDDFSQYMDKEDGGAGVACYILGFGIVILIKYLARLIKWAFRNKTKSE